MRPVVVVHGIFDSAERIDPLTRGLCARGVGPLSAIDLTPRYSTPPLEVFAQQLASFVAETLHAFGATELDLVGFSMGALVTRLYLQELATGVRVRRFVSISGPHRGTQVARLAPKGWPRLAGVAQMKPHSALLVRLGDDAGVLAPIRVHCLYTPFDAMIVPASSGVLRGATSVHRIPVLVHRLMLHDARVHDCVAQILTQDPT
jgi:pimeloyl-ACP methyl ester carboxylesterase